jgi:maleate isomerase
MTNPVPTLGLVYPDDMWVDQDLAVVMAEWQAYLGPEVRVVSARTYVPMRPQTVELGIWLAENGEIEAAAARLMRYRPQVVAYYCTTVSFVRGAAGDADLIRRMQAATGVPCTTTSRAVVEALRALGIRRVATASPYMPDVDQALTSFLHEHGIEVVSSRPLHLSEDHGLVPAERIRAAAESADVPAADGILISCTGQKAAGFLADLERRLGKPVVTSNQATGWLALQMLGLEPRLPRLGRLFEGDTVRREGTRVETGPGPRTRSR